MIPNLVILIWYASVRCDGSFLELLRRIYENGPIGFLFRLWTSVDAFSPLSSAVIFGYSAWALLLMIVVPGRRTEGPMTAKGNVPIYKDNGFACYSLTMLAFALLTVALKLTGRTPTVVYDHFDEFIVTITVISYVFCLFLYVKGRLWPSTSDSGTSGNFVFDYFWGLELYPRILGIDVKVFTNCRFGMTVWPLLVCIYTLKSYELHGGFVDSAWVSAVLQLVYITKFFWWEAGYMRTIDIKLDRAGYYICWGCLVYVPGVYASVSMYLVNQPVHLGPVVSLLILLAGLVSCATNYWADRQKQVVRSTNGNCKIWGRKPEVIHATYRLENGDRHQSLLLVSGFWGLARHFHYVPEMVLAFLWTVPALFQNLLPFSYLISLFFLLLHRTYRDDLVCKNKYKEHWDEYVCRVPYKILPHIF
jgi:7-dehydrocholesterol reductase